MKPKTSKEYLILSIVFSIATIMMFIGLFFVVAKSESGVQKDDIYGSVSTVIIFALLSGLSWRQFLKAGKNNKKTQISFTIAPESEINPLDYKPIKKVDNKMTSGVHEVYRENPAMKIDEKLSEVLHKMLDSDIYSVYMAFHTVRSQLQRESFGAAPFKLDLEVLEHLKSSLLKNKDELMEYKKWNGLKNQMAFGMK